MGKQTITTYICDVADCENARRMKSDAGKVIDTTQEYLQAGAYGFYAHKQCFLELSPVELCKLLGLDEVEVERQDDSGDIVSNIRVWAKW